ncbi:cysteinyl-tRNA synthetase [Geomicrobium sp. JCM 19037]|uniref:DUF402 domain-containing protein n=1 Tax=unclassified Geomicrobium TaxID=2628951 RepID=UPI00045F1023|nr:DUF402 domain-containing protein [Geomicrobium sp. JCM 19037]GAK06013.1 cysteinyl-tRNA synthetase [Geomicrobium sp. JCM 19037]
MLPIEGDTIEIRSYKHNGSLHRVWEQSTVLKSTSQEIIGGNDKIIVQEGSGHAWRTREPAIFYFHHQKWFNIIAMIRNDGIHYYCNIGTPCAYDSEALKYIDYDLDIKVYPDNSMQLLDEDEYEEHRKLMKYPFDIEQKVAEGVGELKSWIYQGKGPFQAQFVEQWYEQFLLHR